MWAFLTASQDEPAEIGVLVFSVKRAASTEKQIPSFASIKDVPCEIAM